MKYLNKKNCKDSKNKNNENYNNYDLNDNGQIDIIMQLRGKMEQETKFNVNWLQKFEF